MGTKHDVLTEQELGSFRVNHRVIAQLEDILSKNPGKTPEEVNVLDWGCGRGRSVAKLREKGFNAFGVDIDIETMSNGFSLFEKRGLSPRELLKSVDDVSSFDDGFFHLIFSEQVFEHVDDLAWVISEQARLTATEGIGVHCFPGSNNVWEGHLFMPFVHWLPKTLIRKYWITIMLLISYGPKVSSWPETVDKTLYERADIYFRYINEQTYYRDNEHIRELFDKNGFYSYYEVNGMKSYYRKMFPKYLRNNGFPRGSVTFIAMKEESNQNRTSASSGPRTYPKKVDTKT